MPAMQAPQEQGISLKARMCSQHDFQQYIKSLRDSGTLETVRTARLTSSISQTNGRASLRKSRLLNTLARKQQANWRNSPAFRDESDQMNISCAEEGPRQQVLVMQR